MSDPYILDGVVIQFACRACGKTLGDPVLESRATGKPIAGKWAFSGMHISVGEAPYVRAYRRGIGAGIDEYRVPYEVREAPAGYGEHPCIPALVQAARAVLDLEPVKRNEGREWHGRLECVFCYAPVEEDATIQHDASCELLQLRRAVEPFIAKEEHHE